MLPRKVSVASIRGARGGCCQESSRSIGLAAVWKLGIVEATAFISLAFLVFASLQWMPIKFHSTGTMYILSLLPAKPLIRGLGMTFHCTCAARIWIDSSTSIALHCPGDQAQSFTYFRAVNVLGLCSTNILAQKSRQGCHAYIMKRWPSSPGTGLSV
jgi:hypothetical protein